MDKTCFVCFGKRDQQPLIYQEIPRKQQGEEFFLFISTAGPAPEPALKRLFRSAISLSRLGHPAQFFLKLLDFMRNEEPVLFPDDGYLSNSLIVGMVRRSREVYLFHNRGIEAIHWSGETEIEDTLDSLPEVETIPLQKTREQQDLFNKTVEEQCVLQRFSLPAGSHTLVFAPSREFVKQHREKFLDSIFFPSFTAPREEGINIETDLTFPAMHWDIPAGCKETAKAWKRGEKMRRSSLPVITGAVALIAAILIIFNPFDLGQRRNNLPDSSVLLSADNGTPGVEAGKSGREELPPGGNLTEEGSPAGEDLEVVSLQEGWKQKFDAALTSSPVVCGEDVIFGCRDGYLYSFTVEGKFKWKYRSGSGIGASPVCYADRVFGADYEGNIFCLDVNNGERIWNRSVREKIVSSPRVGEDLVIAATLQGKLLALRRLDGEEMWSQKIGEGIWASCTLGDGYIVAATTDGSLIRMNHSGKIEWRVQPGGSIHSTPLCMEENDLIILGTGDKYIYGYSLAAGNLMWRFAAASEVRSTPSAAGGTIFVGTEEGVLFALTLNGKQLWKRDVGGAIRSKPLILGEIVLVSNYNSRISVFKTDSGELVDEYQVGAPVYSSPAHAAGRIFFGSNQGMMYGALLSGV
ncbi:MAG: PQQ-binding-like beta-propeller repeat protein [Candidatus Krumholzibacteriota bacterium]|nr:PQQ-binding-like beta-propeller repeat protein [Candidatus Krumholzibacteriota bacterium]